MKKNIFIISICLVTLLLIFKLNQDRKKQVIISQLQSHQTIPGKPKTNLLQQTTSQNQAKNIPDEGPKNWNKKEINQKRVSLEHIREISSRDENTNLEIIRVSNNKMTYQNSTLIFDFFASEKKLPMQKLVFESSNKFIYDNKNGDHIGLAIKNNQIGSLTGEVLFKKVNFDDVKRIASDIGLEKIFENKNMNIIIFKVKSIEDFKNIFAKDSPLKKYNPEADIVFSKVKAQ